MNNVIIKCMAMHYFKGVKEMGIEFAPDRTVISGPNGCGKSTIMDAFFWCLWGKNAQGQQQFGIKTVDEQGVEIPHVDHEVSVTIEVGGKEQTFTRNMQPQYDRNDELKGNVVAYSWNGVPMKKGDYDRQVAAVISEEVFKLITSPTAFLMKKADEQRAILLKMAGDVAESDVADALDGGEQGDFHNMLAALDGTTLDMLKKQIDAELRPINESLSTLPARIDENRRNMPEMPDVEALTEERERLTKAIADVEKASKDEAESINLANQERNALLKQIAVLKAEQQKVLDDVQRKEREQIHKENVIWNQADADWCAIEGEEAADERKTNTAINQMNSTIEYSRKCYPGLTQKLQEMREAYMAEGQKEFKAEGFLHCPLFGHVCTDQDACGRYNGNQQKAYEAFMESKAARQQAMVAQGQALAAQVKRVEQEIDEQLTELQAIKDGFTKRSKERKKRQENLRAIMDQHPRRPLLAMSNGEDVPEWVKLGKQIEALEEKAGKATYREPGQSWKNELDMLHNQMMAISSEMNKVAQVRQAEQRIADLENQLRTQGAEKAALENRKKMAIQFEQKRMDMVSEGINRMFSMVKWQMWSMQVNGEKKDDCVCLCNGVRWQDANTATRINAGIDIAHTLAERLAGCTAPMFIDNAESVTDIYNPGMQQVLLRVDGACKKLHITV